MRTCFLLAAALSLLALGACDAGHREADRAVPGGDNAFPGPELAITTPGPGQRFPAGAGLPVVMFDLRNTQTADRRAGDRIHYSLDGGSPRTVADPTRRVRLEGAATAGPHVIRAWVAKADGTPYANPESKAERTFHIASE